MSKLSFTLLLSWFLLSFNLQAQTETIVFGFVRDPDLNEKMVGVNIVVDGDKSTTTDAEGKYRLNVLPGKHNLVFTFVGYEKTTKNVTVKAGELKQLNANLISSNNELGTVVVTSSQYEKKLAQETLSMDVIGKDLVKNTNSRDLAEALGKDPGVQIQDGQISIRGGNSYSYGVGSRTAVMVDGQSYASADLGEALVKFAPIEDAEQIEIVKGAASVVYGSSAIDGVVNLVTGWPKGDKPVTNITTYVGVYTKPVNDSLAWWSGRQPNYFGVTVNHKQKIGQLQLVIGGNIDNTQSFLQSADEFRGRVNWKTRYLPKNKPKISFGLNGNVQEEASGRFFLSKSLTPDSAYLVKQGSNDQYVRTELNPHFTYHDDNGQNYKLNINYLNVWRHGNGADVNASSNSLSLDNQYQYNFKKKVIITAGVPLNLGFSKSNLYAGTYVNWATAVYLQAEYNYKRLSLQGGLRYEVTAVDTILERGIPVFRAGLNYHAGKATFLRASWGQGYRLPTVGERYVTATFLDAGSQSVFVIPNPALKSEKSWTAEMGIKQVFKIRNWNAYFDFALFWSEFNQFVQYDLGTYPNELNGKPIFPNISGNIIGLRPRNLEKARVAGWEAAIGSQGNIGDFKLTSLIGYTYTYPGDLQGDPSQRDVGTFLSNAFSFFTKKLNANNPADAPNLNKLLSLRSRHTFRGNIDLEYKKFSIGFTGYYLSFPENVPTTYQTALIFLGVENSYIKYNDQHNGGDFSGDGRAGFAFTDKVKLYLIVKNINNRFYLDRIGKPSPPRAVVLQLSVTF